MNRLVYTSTYNVVFGGQEIKNGDESLPYLPLDKVRPITLMVLFCCQYRIVSVLYKKYYLNAIGLSLMGWHNC